MSDFTTNTRALFLGPECENMDDMKNILDYVLTNLQEWREEMRNGVPSTSDDLVRDAEYNKTMARNLDVVKTVCEKLYDCCPFTKPVYFGHMCSDTLMASNLSYFAAQMRNQNNVAYEASPATTRLEFEVGDQILGLFGMNPEQGMIHITSCGSIANIEAYWKLRNIKSLALAFSQAESTKHLVEGKSEYELLTMPLDKIYELIDITKKDGTFQEARELTVRYCGMRNDVGHIVLPASKHYSHIKACDVLGIGQHLAHEVPVHEDYAVDMKQYREIVIDLVEKKIPIMAAVAVIGSTENGAFDDIHELVNIRKYVEETYGVSFPIMIDSAYGGYVRAMIIDAQGKEMTFEECKAYWEPQLPGFITKKFYDSFYYMNQADVVVVDPHKLGYVPYGAGCVAFRDARILDASAYSAAYVFNEQESAIFRRIPGSVTLEGSRPGATVAGVFGAHLACPLNVTGYGQLMADTLKVSRLLEKWLDSLEYEVDGHKFKVYTSPNPDFHMINWAIKDVADNDLANQCKLNEFFYERCSILDGKYKDQNFLVSSTTFTEEEYSEAPWAFVEKMGYPRSEWERVKEVYSLRSTCMNAWLKTEEQFNKFAPIMSAYFEQLIKEYLAKNK